MRYETPRELLTRLKTGREESMQRLLTTLILGAPYPRWNTPMRPCAAGIEWLRELYALSFGPEWPGVIPTFVDEYELRSRTDDERGGAPDHVLLWPDRVWIIELKSEAASHRTDQLPMYLELAHHYFPDALIDLTYLTPPLAKPVPMCPPWARYAHVTWQQVQPLLRVAWPNPDESGQREVVDGLCEAIDLLHLTPTEWRQHITGAAAVQPAAPTHVQFAGDLAAATAADGMQRGVEVQVSSLDDLLELRSEIQDSIRSQPEGSPLRHVRPWIWRQESSGGVPLTELGAAQGYELRLSRYKSAT